MPRYVIFLATAALLVVGVLFVGATRQVDAGDLERAYFRIVTPAGEPAVAGIARHEFPGQVVSVQAKPAVIAALERNPNLEFRGYASKWQLDPLQATLDGKGGTPGPNAKPGGRACVLSDFGLPQVWYGVKQVYNNPNLTSTSGGTDVDVAVFDTGAKKTHPDISRRIERCRDATGTGIKNGCDDRDGHGTNVSSIIAADTGSDGRGIWGVAPQAGLWIYRVCSTFCWSDDVARAMFEATDLGADVINMSFSGPGLAADEQAALDYAHSRGVLLVASAGNSGPDPNTIGYPAAYVKVMGIAAIDEREATADFSSRGINDGDYVAEERELDMAAAGVKILGAYKDGCYAYYWGTSQAAPHVSGLGAKLWQGSGAATRTFLQNRARLHDLNGPGDDPQTGFGLPTVP